MMDNLTIDWRDSLTQGEKNALAALDLWKRWWKETDGSPWVGDTTDYGRDDSCFFCQSSIGEPHEDDCIYVLVSRLLGRKILA